MSSSHRKQIQTINELKQSVKGLQYTVYQLIGGLFNHQTQSDVIEMHVESLNSFKCKDREEIQDAYIWPTTRQGDALELRMNAMELRLHYLEEENMQQKARIQKLEAEKASQAHMKEAEVAIYEIKEAVRHIGAGLYNQETQRSAWRQLKTMFYHDGRFEEMEEDEREDWKTNTSKWENMFTTRQGDICEEKIALIEKKLADIIKALA